jgi:hypothetical protein
VDTADVLARRAQEDPKVQKIVERAHRFSGLKENPAWAELYEEVKRKKKNYMEGFARRLMAGELVDQREIDYHRGFYQGAVWILAHPEEAEAALERAARNAWLIDPNTMEGAE